MSRLEAVHQIFDELVGQERADDMAHDSQTTLDLLDSFEPQTWPEVVAELLFVPAPAVQVLPKGLAELAMRLAPLQPAVTVDLAEAKTATLMQVSEGVVENYEEQDDE